jgi:hypothetical protein
MSNYLENGTVLPYGLLGADTSSAMAAFNKSYKNTALRMGIILKGYSVNEAGNYSKLSTEYDVLVFEQNENVSCTNITYRNCLSSEGMGSVADFFERNLRIQTVNNNEDGAVNTSNQNGAIVLLLCMDGFTNKAVIISSITHPDRSTTLVDTDPHLEGTYNGVNIVVNSDGSTGLTFNGATNNDGKVIDSSQGVTTATVEKDGSLQFQNSEITIRMDKTNKELTLTSTGKWTVNIQGDTNITTQGDANIIAQGNTVVDGATIKLGANASHAIVLGDELQSYINSLSVATAMGPSGPPIVPMPASTLSTKSSTE